jgi:transaldolase
MCKLGVRVISPFVGRLDDLDVDGIEGIYEMRAMIDTYGYETQILAASLRCVRHVHQALLAGADIVTISPDIFEKSMQHPLTDSGMQKFLTDWQKLGVRKFP